MTKYYQWQRRHQPRWPSLIVAVVAIEMSVVFVLTIGLLWRALLQ